MPSVAALSRLVLVLSLGASVTLVAETWTSELGLSGLVVPGTWAPLRVDVEAAWGPWSLEVERSSVRSGGRSVEVFQRSAGGHFETALLVPEDADNLILRVVVDGQVRAERTMNVSQMAFPGHIVGVWGLPPGAQRALSAVLQPDEPVRVVDLPPRLWPNQPLAWQGLSAIALPDPGPVLAPAQVTSVRAWINNGGRLILIAPRSPDASLAGQIETLPHDSSSKGWGGIALWDVAATSRELLLTDSWNSRLALRPFQEQPSLVRALATRTADKALPEAPVSWLLPVAALWCAACLVLISRRKGSIWWAGGLSAVAFVGLFGALIGNALPLDRGTVTQSRLAVLPGGDAVELGSVSTERRAPWGWSTLWNLQPLTIDPVDGTRLVHTADSYNPASDVSLATTGPLRAGWIRWLSPKDLAARDLGTAAYRLSVRAGRPTWSGQSAVGWTVLENVPASLKADELWLRRVAFSHPSEVWEIGAYGPEVSQLSSVWIRPVAEVTL